MSNSGMKTCPECAEEIKLEAKVCRYCGTTFSLVQVGYCIRCHKVTAQSELGVCAVCGSRLLDVRQESLETAGPTIGAQGAKPVSTSVPGFVAPGEPVNEITDESVIKTPAETAAVPATPAPGPPPGVAWVKPGASTETVPPVHASVGTAVGPEPEPEAAAPVQPPAEPTSDIVAERLAAFGRREPAVPTPPTPPAPSAGPPVPPPPGPPIAPPPGPPVTTPRPPVAPLVRPPVSAPPPAPPSLSAPPVGVGHPVTSPAVAPVVHPEPQPKPAEEKPAEPAPAAGQRLGIVPSLAQRAAYPFYLLSAVIVLAMWFINFYWDGYLKGTSDPGSQTLSHFILATYGGHGRIMIGWQVGLIAVICILLAPMRLLPTGWFRTRGVAKEYAKELKAELAVDMVFTQRYYFQKTMLAVALWAIAIAAVVAPLVKKGSFVFATGGYVTIAALLVGFACAGVLAARREPVVAIDTSGRIQH